MSVQYEPGTEGLTDPNRHLQAALEAVAETARKLKEERDEAREELCHLRACVFDALSALDAGAFVELKKAWEEGAK